MSLPSLYKLTAEMESLMESDEVTDDQLQTVFGAIQEKAANIAQYIAVLDGQVDVFKAEEKRLTERRKAIENHKERIKAYIKQNMETLGIDKLDAGTFSIALQNSPPSLVVDDETAIPAKFIKIIQTTQVDKKGISDELKKGGAVAGCHIEQGQHLRIR